MGSLGAKIASETGAEWAFRRAKGPRWGGGFESGLTLRRLLALRGIEVGRREDGAGGESDFFVDQKPTEWSEDADRILDDGW